MEEKIIIGLTGSFGSGCTSVAKILHKLGFQTISISSLLKKEAERQGIDLSKLPRKEVRKVLQDIGNKKREQNLGILIQEALKSPNFSKDIVIESIKNPGEIKALKQYPNSYIVALDTDFDIRIGRILDKEYDGDKKQFEKDDLRERDEYGKDYGQKIQKCVDLADVVINNNKERTTPEERKDFEEIIMKWFIKLMKKPGSRSPTDIELWMNNAYSISLQSECIQRQVGAVIIKEGFVIASGKNHVPPGEKTCKTVYDGKCYRDELRKNIKYCSVCKSDLDEDFNCKTPNCEYNERSLGKLLDKCRSLHAEENAILQISRLGGISLKDSIIVTTTFPCNLCAHNIASVGIKEVIYVEAYPDLEAINFFKKHPEIKLTKFEGVKASAFHKLFKGQ